MTTTIKFTKMHGAGNDYIYVNTLLYNIADPAKAAIAWSAPHTGIGSDGLVLIGESKLPEADYSMRIFNADGSEAMMCGNASRCIGKYLFEKGITDKTQIRLLTLSGIKILNLHLDAQGKKVESVTVDMLEPLLANRNQMASEDGSMTDGLVDVVDREFRGTFVSMGNPHFVIFVDNIAEIDVEKYGKALEYDPLFPERCNIEFAQVLGDGQIRTREGGRKEPHESGGAGQRNNHGVRNRSLCNGRCGGKDRTGRQGKRHRHGRRNTAHRMERGRQPCIYDRSCGVRLRGRG